MLRAIIFDFNGIILNDEPLHYRSMRDSVAELGIQLSEQSYWAKYLPFDDVNCLQAICADHSVQLSPEQLRGTLARKAALYQKFLRDQYPLFPGAAQFIRSAAGKYPLALASGARRDEIERALDGTGLRRYFKVLVGAEDFTRGKPHPESFLFALSKLNESIDGRPRITPPECLVIEDSVAGVQGARAAGMMCMAVTNTYPRERLLAANLTIASLQEMSVDNLQSLLEELP